jgi:hypothetical protein
MAASSSTQKASSSPCGCGGSKSATASPCGCGGGCGCGGTCSLCQGTGYSRPRFFAGQLLTEDDLQQLNDYVVAKNRLHARHLFGAGVVCGLEVTCYPCGGGKVIVDPGYALDCCGNDIVVSCPQELDINQMVRDLQRKRHGGLDCGDPCPDNTSATAPSSQTPAGISRISGMDTNQTTKPACQKYCLYVNYCEQPSDPVSPYATDDPCTTQQCEATRVREGFRFELRCPDPNEPDPAICQRINDCLGQAPDNYRKSAGRLRDLGLRVTAASRSIQERNLTSLPSDFPTIVQAHAEAVHKALDEHLSNPQALVDATLNLGSDVALSALLNDPDPDTLKKTGARELLQKASKVIGDLEIRSTHLSDLERANASSLSDLVKTGLRTQVASSGGTTVRTISATAGPLPLQQAGSDLVQLLAQKVVYGVPLHNLLVTETDNLRTQLAFRLEQAQMKTRCDLLDTVNSAPKPTKVTTANVSFGEIYQAGTAARVIGGAWIELERACYCNALNPPCPPCDDPGLLLACITIEQCKVKDICNLDRQFVLSPVAIRYWIPEITRIGRAIEKACCPAPCPEKNDLTWGRDLSAGTSDPSAYYASLVFQLLRSACPEKGATQKTLAGMFAPLADTSAAERLKELEASVFDLRAAHADLIDQISRMGKQQQPKK